MSRTWIEGKPASTEELWEIVLPDWQYSCCESTEGIGE